MKVKGTVKAWVTQYGAKLDQIESSIKDGNKDAAVSGLYYTNAPMQTDGWFEVGVATITVEFFPREAIVSKQIEGLREQLRQHRVNAENAEQAILSQISNLMAITG